MMQEPSASGVHDPSMRAHAGAMLREAREAAGLSLDAVSQQLKLAPRQVQALEDGDFNLLPGRTFVRGFARNYARLVRLDPDTVLGALPGAATAGGGLEAPPLNPTTGTMGELPHAGRTRPAWVRWSIPLAIVLAIAVAAGYEYMRGSRKSTTATVAATTERAPAPAAPVAPASTAPAGAPSATPLTTPVTTTLSDGSAAAAAGTSGQTPVPSTASDATLIAPVNIATRGPTWIEVRDSTGRMVMSQTLDAGQTQAIVGAPPFDIVIGNAPDVTLTFRGRTIDLAPYTRQNVARLTLQ